MRKSPKLRAPYGPLRLLYGVLALSHATGPLVRPPFHFLERSASPAALAAPQSQPHPSYRYSVIAGGAYSIPELDSALRDDPVARDHYSVFDRPRLHMTVSPAAHMSYVSYRKDGAVYWTRRPLPIPAGELLITDGRNRARARCGNRLSDTPRRPVAFQEPPASELDKEETVLPPPPGSLRATAPEDVFPSFLRGVIAPPLAPAGSGPAHAVPPPPIVASLPEPSPEVPWLGLPFIPYYPVGPPASGVPGTPPNPAEGGSGGSIAGSPTESNGGPGPFPGPAPTLPGPTDSAPESPGPEAAPEPGSGLLFALGLLAAGCRLRRNKLK